MHIAILGAGAMGTLFGAYLSKHNDVILIDTSSSRVQAICERETLVVEGEDETIYSLRAYEKSTDFAAVDLLIVFVKSMYTRRALQMNVGLIDDRTFVMSLQNGAGHDKIIREFVDPTRVIIGTTQHNSSFLQDGRIHHGGGGVTVIGLTKENESRIQAIADNFTRCGIETQACYEVEKLVWRKLLLNASASSLTAVLRCKLGFILENENASNIMKHLALEAIAVANQKLVQPFSVEEELERIYTVLKNAPDGITSICADICHGKKTEVDSISGYVTAQADEIGMEVPYQKCIVSIIHAMEASSC